MNLESAFIIDDMIRTLSMSACIADYCIHIRVWSLFNYHFIRNYYLLIFIYYLVLFGRTNVYSSLIQVHYTDLSTLH